MNPILMKPKHFSMRFEVRGAAVKHLSHRGPFLDIPVFRNNLVKEIKMHGELNSADGMGKCSQYTL